MHREPNGIKYKSRFKCNIGMPKVGKRCNDVEHGNIAWTKNPLFRNPGFSGMLIASLPGQRVFLTFLSLVQLAIKNKVVYLVRFAAIARVSYSNV